MDSAPGGGPDMMDNGMLHHDAPSDHHNMHGMMMDHDGTMMSVAADNVEAALSESATAFCATHGSSTGMTMYMSGFRFGLTSDATTPCLNLFFPSWVLDTRGKFVAAILFVLVLAVSTEGISAYRMKLRRRLKPGSARKATIMAVHAAQALIGYVLMLATMTFAVEMMMSTVAGLAIGYGVFFDDAAGAGAGTHVTTNPCCGFMADEAADMQERPIESSQLEPCCGEDEILPGTKPNDTSPLDVSDSAPYVGGSQPLRARAPRASSSQI